MKAFEITYWIMKDETNINYSKEFKLLHPIEQLNILKDAISDLTDKYDELLEKWHKNVERFKDGDFALPKRSKSKLRMCRH